MGPLQANMRNARTTLTEQETGSTILRGWESSDKEH